MLKHTLVLSVLFSLATVQAMEFVEDPDTSGVVTLNDDSSKVFSYNYGEKLPAGVDSKFTRSSFLHPIWDLNGNVLTDNFPRDHYHHHGVFWGWPIVKTRGVTTDNWMHGTPSLRPHFVRWINKTANESSAILTLENRWLLDEKEEVARELVTIQTHPVTNSSRAIDVQIKLEAVGGPLTLQGSQEAKKGYGGFSFRAAPSLRGARISTDTGIKSKDIMMERARWSDLTTSQTGIAIFVAPSHPGYPPYSFARNSYTGFLNPSWPGLASTELLPGKPVTLRYRLYIHRGSLPVEDILDAYDQYVQQIHLRNGHSI